MAGNFWSSSHVEQWLFTRQDLLRGRKTDLEIINDEEYQKLFVFLADVVQSLGEQMQVRQQVIATATVYLRRFYSRNSLKCVDPLLLIPTCLFLASKVEEFGLLSCSKLINTFQSILKKQYTFVFPDFPYRANQVTECEFLLLEVLDCSLIVYHPYRPLTQFVNDMSDQDGKILSLSWRIANDSLRTDACLLYPPYIIALGCLYTACAMLDRMDRDTKQWFAELNIDLEKIIDVVRTITCMYNLWRPFDEKAEIPSIIAKLPKPNGPSSVVSQEQTLPTGT